MAKKDQKDKKVSIKDIISQVGGNEDFTKKRRTDDKVYNTLRDNIRLEEDAALMIDVLELPTAKFGFKYCLVAVDIASKECDLEALKNKTADAILAGFKKMLNRNYINLPKYYMISDNGKEFLGAFHKYLWDNNVIHQQTLKGRHKSLSMVDSLCATLGRIFNAYMNAKEKASGKVFKNWTDVLPKVREQLNKARKVDLPKDLKKDSSQALVQDVEEYKTKKGKVTKSKFKVAKYKVGDMVYRPLENPENMLGDVQYGKFREGDVRIDKVKRKITELVYMNGKGPFVRYILEGLPNVSYSEQELRDKL